MEKHIASHDLSDMMVYEGMQAQSRKFHFKQPFAPLGKVIEKVYKVLELAGKITKRSPQRSLHMKETEFSTTATAIYSISVASVLISFFWLTLLLSPNT